jgi:hypothetical protein
VINITQPPSYKPPAVTQAPIQVVTLKPPTNPHPTTAFTPEPTTNPPVIHFGTGDGPHQWSIQTSSPDHHYSGHNQLTATGEWGRAFINSQGLVQYKQDSNLMAQHTEGPNDRISTTTVTHTVTSQGTGGQVINPGGKVMTNNGAFHGNAWWKHPVPGTSQVITEQIESRSHNEFYDVFKDGQYVGTYQMSADATHITQAGYTLWREQHKNGNIHNPHMEWVANGTAPPIDEWHLNNVLVRPLPPEPTGLPADPPDLNEEPTDQTEEEIEVDVKLDPDDQDLQQSIQDTKTTTESTTDSTTLDHQGETAPPINADLIANALKVTALPEITAENSQQEVNPLAEQATETPTPQQIVESLDQLTGAKIDPVADTKQTPDPDALRASEPTAPSSQEIAEATEQVIASAPSPTTEPSETLAKAESQDPFRDAPLDTSPQVEESLTSEDVLAEEPPQAVDEQNDDDPPLLG